jgi:hypothetical protein
MQWRGELVGKQAAIEAQLAELHHHKSALGTEWCIIGDLTNGRVRSRDVAAAINHEGTQHPSFTRASTLYR